MAPRSNARESALAELFLALFEPEQLRRFIRAYADDAAHELPFAGSAANLAAEAAQVLGRRNLIDATLFRRLAAARPRHHSEVLVCASNWDIDEQAIPPPSADALAGDRNLHAAPQLYPGLTVAGYRLVRPLGIGGYGAVWLSETPDGASAALKILRSDLGHDTALRERFLRGAQRMRSVDHPSIVRVLDIDNGASGYHCYAMQFIDGDDLHKLCKAGRISARSALSIIVRLAGAVAACHASGLIHGDIKPKNVVVDRQGIPYLADFDFVTLVDAAVQSQATTPGTFGFMAPEALSGRGVRVQSDIYSLGVTAIFSLRGRDFGPGDDLRAQIAGLPCSPATKAVLARATAREPGERQPTMEAFRRELERSRAPGLRRRADRLTRSAGALAVCCGAVLVTGERGLNLATSLPETCPPGMIGIPGGELPLSRGGSITIDPFCLDTYEVTMAQHQECVASRGCTKLEETVTKEREYSRFCNHAWDETRLDHPVNCASWYTARDYCAKSGHRLPSEHEFEWASRGGELAHEFPWPRVDSGQSYVGSEFPRAALVNGCGTECEKGFADLWKADWRVMYEEDDGHAQTAPVGSYPAAPLGPFDLAGNIMEWTSSGRENGYVLKGGSWFHTDALKMRASGYSIYPPSFRLYYFGFRCASDGRG